jgi:hypothetical protein
MANAIATTRIQFTRRKYLKQEAEQTEQNVDSSRHPQWGFPLKGEIKTDHFVPMICCSAPSDKPQYRDIEPHAWRIEAESHFQPAVSDFHFLCGLFCLNYFLDS